MTSSTNSLSTTLFSTTKIVVLDGGLGTELENRGVNVNSTLWSSQVILTQPQQVCSLHRDYYEAGADIGITCTYQGSQQSLEDYGKENGGLYGSYDQRKAFYEKCVDSIIQGKQSSKTSSHNLDKLVVSASIGPYGAALCDGAEFSGYYKESNEFYKKFHKERLDYFSGNKNIDCLAVETIPVFGEVKALVEVLENQSKQYFLSFSIKDSLHLADGTSISDVVAYLNDKNVFTNNKMLAIGANCLKLRYSVDFLKNLQSLVPSKFPLIIYPNSGEIYDGITKKWHQDPECVDVKYDWENIVGEWVKYGARVVGGCCRVGVADIERISKKVREINEHQSAI